MAVERGVRATSALKEADPVLLQSKFLSNDFYRVKCVLKFLATFFWGESLFVANIDSFSYM